MWDLVRCLVWVLCGTCVGLLCETSCESSCVRRLVWSSCVSLVRILCESCVGLLCETSCVSLVRGSCVGLVGTHVRDVL